MDLFSTHATETDWEWAWKRRRFFKTPLASALAAIGTFAVGLPVRRAAGDKNWLTASLVAGVVALVVAVAAPFLEVLLIWLFRHKTKLEDLQEEQRLAAINRGPVRVQPPATSAPDRPRAEVTFDCDETGWARLRITNAGAGASFSATVQLFGITAGAVEGMQIPAKWDLVDVPVQRIAHADTKVIRLASVTEIASGVRAWAIHRAGATDIRSVNLGEYMEVRIVAEPDLDKPCHLQIMLNADGGSRMVRVGVDPPLFHHVPQRVADMRRLLAEVAEYVRHLRGGRGNAKDAVWMAVTVHEKVAELLGQAFGPREIAVYEMKIKEAEAGGLREASAAFLFDKAQRVTEEDILGTFPLPISWVQFCENQPGWEWPDYD